MAEEKGVQRSGGEAEGDQASLETQVTHYSLLRVSVSPCVSLFPQVEFMLKQMVS